MQELAALLRKETHTLHKRVESSAFMKALLSSQLGKSAYVLLLRNLEPIYGALEEGLTRHASAPGILPIEMQPLFRRPSLHRDLQFLHGISWFEELPQLGACSAYVDHLQAIQVHTPERLTAHAYVRYLGDLSGGQMLRQIVVRSLKLTDADNGVDFYNFGESHVVAALALKFRQGLDQIGAAGDGQTGALLEEAQLAFELHLDLFNDLARGCGLLPTQRQNEPSINSPQAH
jgi:heme oxygenase (biliverdin-producing, ferredoxin)